MTQGTAALVYQTRDRPERLAKVYPLAWERLTKTDMDAKDYTLTWERLM